MAKPKISHKDLRKTSFKKKEVFYPSEQTDEGKNKGKLTAWELRRLQR